MVMLSIAVYLSFLLTPDDFHIHSCTKPSTWYLMVYYSTFSAFGDCECSLNDRLCYTLTYIASSVHVISMDAQLLKKWLY